jgi:hypothetical protein
MLLIAAAATFGEDMNMQSVRALTEIAFSGRQAGFDRADEDGILWGDHG